MPRLTLSRLRLKRLLCPVMTKEFVDLEKAATFQGFMVALCRDRCQGEFQLDPEKYSRRLSLPADAIGADDIQSCGVHGDAGGDAAGIFRNVDSSVICNESTWHAHNQGNEGSVTGVSPPPILSCLHPAIAAVISGNIAHDAMRFSKSIHKVVERHQVVSTLGMVGALMLFALRIWPWRVVTGVGVGSMALACSWCLQCSK